MEIAVFYEVQDRLYNAALAGSNILAEDFRLKRAVEGLAALAEKGKVFAALKQKCEKLLEAGEDASSQLADCIALADAIAVTLGHSGAADAEEVFEAEESSGIWRQKNPVSNVSYREMQQALELLHKASENTLKITEKYPEVLTDIRFGAAVAEALNGKASEQGDRFAAIVLEICGDDLKKILKDSLDLSDEAAKGRQVKVIASVYGAKENAWYRQLAQDETVPQKVRLEAISALTCSMENEDLLMELYKTGKGKIKAAAIEALARIGAEGILPYLEKICEKEDVSTTEENLIRFSPAEVCEKYALRRVQWGEDNPQKSRRLDLLDYKTGPMAEEACIRLANVLRKRYRGVGGVQDTLISNLIEGSTGTVEMIQRLYMREPDKFSEAYAYSRLLAGALTTEDIMRVKGTLYPSFRVDEKCPPAYKFASEMARKLRAIPVINKYRIEWQNGMQCYTEYIGEQFPQVLLDVLTGKDALKSFHATAECCVTLSKMCLGSDPATKDLAEDYGYSYSIGAWDHERIMSAAIPFLENAIEAYPAVYYGSLAHVLIPDRKGRVDLYYEFVCKNAELMSQTPAVSPGGGWLGNMRVEIPDREQMVKEYQYAKDQLNKLFCKVSKEYKQKIMSVIDEVI